MKAWPLLPIAAALAGCAPVRAGSDAADTNAVIPAPAVESPAPARGGGTFLLSIEGITLGPGDFIESFSVETWAVDFLAVCHLPPGWEIRAGRSAAPDGLIAGEGSHGVTWLSRPRLGELSGLALVRLHGPVEPRQVELVPPTFRGRARIGRYGLDESRREVPLTTANIRLTPAATCPPPT